MPASSTSPPSSFVTLEQIHAAQRRIAAAAVRTPLLRLAPGHLLAAGVTRTLPPIFLKDESQQPIGSFKLRGAYNKIAALSADELRRGVITYSSGNHAQGVAYAARALGARAVIVMPSNAPAIKRKATEALGAEIVTVGNGSLERKARAEELVALHGYIMVPPYDDAAIIAGHATCGVEIAEQLQETHQHDSALVLAPVSGGGLLSGIATGIALTLAEAHLPPSRIAVWGVEPELAGDAHESFRTGRLVEWPAERTGRTLADGLRTQSLGALNFAHIQRHVGGIVTVTEAELRAALYVILRSGLTDAEPSGAVALAGALFHAPELPAAGAIVCVVSGGNIDPALRREILDEPRATL